MMSIYRRLATTIVLTAALAFAGSAVQAQTCNPGIGPAFAAQVRPALTTIALPRYEMGKQAVQLALSHATDAESRYVALPLHRPQFHLEPRIKQTSARYPAGPEAG